MKLLKKLIIGATLFSALSFNTLNYKASPASLEQKINETKTYQHYITPETESINKYLNNSYCVRCLAIYKQKETGGEGSLTLGHATLTMFYKRGGDNYFFTAYHIKNPHKIIKVRLNLENKIWRDITDYTFKDYELCIVDNELDINREDDVLLRVLEEHPDKDFLVLKMVQEDLKDRRWKYTLIDFGNNNYLKEGDIVYSVGFHHSLFDLVSKGIISNTKKGLGPSLDDFVMDININPGVSGGPVYAIRDNKLELVGMFHQYFAVDGRPIGIHYALPINSFKQILEKYIK